MKYISLMLLVLLLFVCPDIWAKTTVKINNKASQSIIKKEEFFTVIMGGAKVGHLKVTTTGNALAVDYDYKNNGRGPTIKEVIILNTQGLPIQWDIAGNTTFGNSVTEHFQQQGQQASWTDATGKGTATLSKPHSI